MKLKIVAGSTRLAMQNTLVQPVHYRDEEEPAREPSGVDETRTRNLFRANFSFLKRWTISLSPG